MKYTSHTLVSRKDAKKRKESKDKNGFAVLRETINKKPSPALTNVITNEGYI